METLHDFGMEVMKIREAANSIEVKGQQNASLVVFIVEKCNEIVKAINNVIERSKIPSEDQNGEEFAKEEGEVNGEPDSGVSE